MYCFDLMVLLPIDAYSKQDYKSDMTTLSELGSAYWTEESNGKTLTTNKQKCRVDLTLDQHRVYNFIAAAAWALW